MKKSQFNPPSWASILHLKNSQNLDLQETHNHNPAGEGPTHCLYNRAAHTFPTASCKKLIASTTKLTNKMQKPSAAPPSAAAAAYAKVEKMDAEEAQASRSTT